MCFKCVFREERLRFWSDPDTELKLAKDTGVQVFRMGIDWTRVMPEEPVHGAKETVSMHFGISKTEILMSDIIFLSCVRKARFFWRISNLNCDSIRTINSWFVIHKHFAPIYLYIFFRPTLQHWSDINGS